MKELGNKTNSKDFVTNSTEQGVINSRLSDINSWALQNIDKIPTEDMYGQLADRLQQVRSQVSKIGELDKGIASSVADLSLKYPGLDEAKLINMARANASYMKDNDGNDQLLDPSQLNPSKNWAQEELDKNPERYFGDKAIND